MRTAGRVFAAPALFFVNMLAREALNAKKKDLP